MRATSVLGGIGLAVPDRSLRSPGRRGTGNAERRRRRMGPLALSCSRLPHETTSRDCLGRTGTAAGGGAAYAVVSHGAWSRKARTETALKRLITQRCLGHVWGMNQGTSGDNSGIERALVIWR
jgi:hypothetical protein